MQKLISVLAMLLIGCASTNHVSHFPEPAFVNPEQIDSILGSAPHPSRDFWSCNFDNYSLVKLDGTKDSATIAQAMKNSLRGSGYSAINDTQLGVILANRSTTLWKSGSRAAVYIQRSSNPKFAFIETSIGNAPICGHTVDRANEIAHDFCEMSGRCVGINEISADRISRIFDTTTTKFLDGRVLFAALANPSYGKNDSNVKIVFDPKWNLYRLWIGPGPYDSLSHWSVLRDSSELIVRDSVTANRLQNDLENAKLGDKTIFSSYPYPNSVSFAGAEAMDSYFKGVSQFHQNNMTKARVLFRTAIRGDTTLPYFSDVNLWISASFENEGQTDSANHYYTEFVSRSQSLCPLSSNVYRCEDSISYARIIGNPNEFNRLITDTFYYANMYGESPNFYRNYYGETSRSYGLKGNVEYGPDLTSDGIGLLLDFEWMKYNDLRPIVFTHLSENLSLLGGGGSYRLLSDKYNRLNVKAKAYLVDYWMHNGKNEYTYLEPMIGGEGSFAYSRRFVVFISGMAYYHSQWNHLTVFEQSKPTKVWMRDYINAGGTFFFTPSLGMTVKNMDYDNQVGLQWYGLFFGYGINSKELMLTTNFIEDWFHFSHLN